MRARNDLRSSRIGSFSRRRGLGHSREAFSGGRRQAGVMKVSRCIAFGTKPALLLCYIVVLHCCVTLYNTLLLCYIVQYPLVVLHSVQTDTHASNHAKVLNSVSLWRTLQKFDVDKSTKKCDVDKSTKKFDVDKSTKKFDVDKSTKKN